MEIPLQITFRDFGHSDAVESRIREHVAKLEQLHDRMTSCRVMVEAHHRRHHKGRIFHVRIDITTPGREIVVNRDQHDKHAHEDVYVALRDAFSAAQRQLRDHVRERRGRTKFHEAPPHGRVVRLVANADHGFLASADGREIYFHRNSVIGADFDSLEVGTEVRFSEAVGDEGPQATSVRPVGKHHIV